MQRSSTKAYRHVNVLSPGDIICENVKDEQTLLLCAGRKLNARLIYLLKCHQIRYVYVEQATKHHYTSETRPFLTQFFQVVRTNNKHNYYAHLFLNEEHSRIIQTLLAAYLQDERLRSSMQQLLQHDNFPQAVAQFSLATLLAKRLEVERLGDIAIAYLLTPRSEVYDQRMNGYFERLGLTHLTYFLTHRYRNEVPLEVQVLQVVDAYITMTLENPTITLHEIYHLLHEKKRWSDELLYHFRHLLEEEIEREAPPLAQTETQALPMRTTITLCKIGSVNYENLLQLLHYTVEGKHEQARAYMQFLCANYTRLDWLTMILLPLKQLIKAGAYASTVTQFIDDLLGMLLKNLRLQVQQQDVVLLIINEKMNDPQLINLLESILHLQKLNVYRLPFIASPQELERLVTHYEAQHVIVIGHAPVVTEKPTYYYQLQELQVAALLDELAGEQLCDYTFMKKLSTYYMT